MEERYECTPYHQGCTEAAERETSHLPQLFSANMAVRAAPASGMHGTFPRFKGPPSLPCFFFFSPHLRAPAHGQHRGLIFQNMFLARTPPSTITPLPPLPPRSPSSQPSSLSRTAHSLFTTYFPPFHSTPPKPPCLPACPPACSPKCVMFFFFLFFSFHISCFAAPLLPSIQSPVQYVLWINKK